MKRLFLSLVATLIGALSFGLQAQGTTALPEVSTATDPIWYELQSGTAMLYLGVNGDLANLGAKDDANKSQMFRFEKDGDKYVVINQNGKYLSSTADIMGKVVLSATKSSWTITLNTIYRCAVLSAAEGCLQPDGNNTTITGTPADENSLWNIARRMEPLEEPTISTSENEVWYYLLNQRDYPKPTNLAITDMSATATTEDVPLKGTAVTAGNNGQLWKFVEKDGGVAMVSKKGNYINNFSTNSTTSTAITWQSPNGSPKAWQVATAGSVMHVGRDGSISAYSTGPESYHVIVSDGDYWGVALKTDITKAEATAAAATVGTEVGQFTQSSIDDFNTAIAAAKAVADNPASTGAQITAAAAALGAAVTTFNASVVMPKLSTESDVTWYYFRSTFDKYTVLKKPFATSRTEDNRISLTNAATGDSYLWKLVAGADGKVILINKVKVGSIQAVKPPVINEEANNNFTLKYVGNGQFTLTADGGVELHADQAGFMVNWNASPIENSASCWSFFEPKVDKATLLASITTATTLKNAAVVGTKGGQYPQAAVDALTTAIAKAQAAHDNASLTLDQFFIESNDIIAAIATFKGQINPAIAIATETVAGKAYRLKYIGSGVNNGKYLSNPRVESTLDAGANARPQVRFTTAQDSSTAFKLLVAEQNPTFFTIHNDRGLTTLPNGGDYIDELGRTRAASAFTAVTETKWQWYSLKAEEGTISATTKVGLYSDYSKKYLIARADTAIATMSADSLPALLFEMELIGPASVENTSNSSSIRVIANDGRIEVYGTETENFQIFTINGVELSKNARLPKGVYFVRIEGKGYKVIVK